MSSLFRFTSIDIGEVGRHSYGGILSNSSFGQALQEDMLSIPAASPLPGDEAFPFHTNMMWPYPGRNFPGTLLLCL